jgi:Glycosyltransferase family 10 (fucosyltransferase) C-term
MNPNSKSKAPGRRIRVKALMGKVSERLWLRQFPGGVPVWGGCAFTFDPDARDYDWLIVYDDLPPAAGERFSDRVELLACPPENTLLVTTEPSGIKTYGSAYTAQFGHVLTSQEAQFLRHPGRIEANPAFQWFFGMGKNHLVPFDALAAAAPPEKPLPVSTVCSAKRQRHTLHRRRYDFTQRLKAALPELDIFGRGVRPIDDKAEALLPYRYHVTIENQVAPHHWTEKLADAFLGFTVPIYCGAPNAAECFPEDSYIPFELDDPGAIDAIVRAVRADDYEKRLPHVLEARRRVLYEHNLFAVLARLIPSLDVAGGPRAGARVMARHALRRRYPLLGAKTLLEKGLTRARFALGRR